MSPIVLILILMCSISMIATDIYLPSMPSMSTYFSAHQDQVQLTVSSYFIGSVIAAFFTGAITDRFGYRHIYVGFAFLFVVASLFCSVAFNLDTLILARLIQGFSRGVFVVVTYAVILDLYGRQKSAELLGLIGMVATILPGIAPIVGGYVDEWFGWRVNFYIVFILSLVGFGTSFLYFKPNITKKSGELSSKEQALSYLEILSSGRYIAFIVPQALLYGGWFCMLTVFPFYFIETIKVTPGNFGLYNAYFVFLWGLGCYLSKYVSRKWGLEQTVLMGLNGSFVGALFLLLTYFILPFSTVMICIGMTVHLISYGILYPPTNAIGLSIFKSKRGIASSLAQTITTASCGLGTYAASLLDDSTLFPVSLFMTILTAMCIFITRKFRRYSFNAKGPS